METESKQQILGRRKEIAQEFLSFRIEIAGKKEVVGKGTIEYTVFTTK